LFLRDTLNHRYKPGRGLPELREAIRSKLLAENGIDLPDVDRIIVTAGANMAFIYALFAIADPGDEIILPLPYYFNHEMALGIANCRAVLVPTGDLYQPLPDLIRRAITRRTRAVVTISPNNPTGAVYSEDSLRQINDLCREHGLYHINDEAYEYFTYGAASHFSPGSIQGSAEHTISIYSLSKSYGFASWRIGYMVAPSHLCSAMDKVQDTVLICPPVISQYAATGALKRGAAYCRERVGVLAEARRLGLEAIQSLDRVAAAEADGAFYFFLRLDTELEDMQVVEKLIADFRVAVLPGSAFGMTQGCFIRVSYGALSKETVVDGIDRLVRGLGAILDR
jgi:aspartate/methionine/tyrosine aminotransferase